MPKLQTVEMRIMPEMSARLAALRAGDIEAVWDVNPEDVKTLREIPALRVDSVATASWDAAVMNNAIPPFNDPRVRRAFHLAVDKRDVVELVLFGEGSPTHSPIPPSHPFFARDIPITRADPAAARRLLREAGHGQGVKVPLIVPVGRPVRERLGVTLQQLSRPAGFEIEIQRVPFARYSAEVAGKAPFYVDGYFARPTLDTATYGFLHSSGSWNWPWERISPARRGRSRSERRWCCRFRPRGATMPPECWSWASASAGPWTRSTGPSSIWSPARSEPRSMRRWPIRASDAGQRDWPSSTGPRPHSSAT
jgi:ABC-type transport system substrate-binding protein